MLVVISLSLLKVKLKLVQRVDQAERLGALGYHTGFSCLFAKRFLGLNELTPRVVHAAQQSDLCSAHSIRIG